MIFFFLSAVEPGPGVDVEGLEVAKQCLEQVFQVESPAADELTKFDSLVDIFSSPESSQRSGTSSFVDNGAVPMDHHSSLDVNDSDANLLKSNPQVSFRFDLLFSMRISTILSHQFSVIISICSSSYTH